MKNKIEQIRSDSAGEIELSAELQQLDDIRVKYLGRKGLLTDMMKELSTLPKDQRPLIGKELNILKGKLAKLIDQKKEQLLQAEEDKQLKAQAVDVTMPGHAYDLGKVHIVTRTLNEIIGILTSLGFNVEYGPEVESDYYNFEALNFPPEHPARDMQDTFYISDNLLMRTHTSPTQIRVMEKTEPPVRVIMPGKCFRNEAIDTSHHIMFNQIEGLYIDQGVTFADLKATLETFLRRYFGPDTKLRFRPSFFPFTEPSAEVDISCFLCGGKGCRACKQNGWVELLGAGMVDPEVFKSVGYDSEKYTGFAWGMGIERIIMMKYGIDDIRLFFENDLRFLKQF
jgi:phenylalanyl-tRNA synthetase alpha chain